MFKFITLLLSFVFCFSGCSLFSHLSGGQGPVKVSADWSKSGIQIVRFETTKEKIRALNQGKFTSKVRLVPLTMSDANATPEYRVFNSVEGSTPYELGMRNADILVAVEGYAVFSPAQFAHYLGILSEKSETVLELKREGKPLRIEIKIAEK